MKKNLFYCLVVLLCYSCSSQSSEQGSQNRLNQLLEQQSWQPMDEYTVFRAPNHPVEITRAITEWDPTSALVLSLPYEDAISDTVLFDFYMEITKKALRCVDVWLMVDERDLASIKDVITKLEAFGLKKYLFSNQPHTVHLVPARFNTKWIRDFGPIFLAGANDQWVMADAVYRDVREESHYDDEVDMLEGTLFGDALISVFGDFPLNRTNNMDRHEDDAASMYLSIHLRQEYGHTLKIVRPPFQLWGGDLLTDGQGNGFISSETLVMNGGNHTDVELILKAYYGINKITYLDPLPGETIKHLDMIFKPIDENTFLAVDYQTQENNDEPYMNYLHYETKRLMDKNIKILQRAFPNRRLVSLPMPPLMRICKLPGMGLEMTQSLFENKDIPLPQELVKNPGLWTFERFLYFIHATNLLMDELHDPPSECLLKTLKIDGEFQIIEDEQAMLTGLVQKIIKNDQELLLCLAKSVLDHEEMSGENEEVIRKGLARIFSHYLYEDIYEDPGNYTYIYRTYHNAVFLNGPTSQMLLVPSYSNCEEMEEEVKRIYEELYPETEIVFINCDDIIQQYGALHCVTTTIPDFTRLDKK